MYKIFVSLVLLSASALFAGTRELSVAIVTHAPEPGGWSANAPVLEQSVRNAAKEGAKFVVLPELAWTGSLKDYAEAAQVPAEAIPGPATVKWGELAKELGIWLIVPVVERNSGTGVVTIAVVLLDHRGEIAALRHKVLARQHAEDGPIARGSFREIQDSIDVGGARIGILSGDDLRVGVPRLAIRGADVIIVASGWTGADPAQWTQVCEQLARENNVALVVTSREPAAFNGLYRPEHVPAAAGRAWTVFQAPMQEKAWLVSSALGLPSTVPVPSTAPGSKALAALGERLFFDRNLSSTGEVACASCHLPDRGFTNAKPKGEGVFGRSTKRNVPTLLNVAFRPLLQWDGYASSLENFAKYPMSGVAEMNFHYLDRVSSYLSSQPSYVRDFRAAVGESAIQFEDVAYALAVYQRTLISGDSAFDRYYYGGRADAMSPSAVRGLALFQGKANCASCHTIGRDYSLFLDFQFHATGVGFNTTTGLFGDIGLGGISTEDQAGLFQTPTLRNAALTAPYMHDGSVPTLEAVIELYNQGGVASPNLDSRIRPLHLSSLEKADLLAFLQSLTGTQYKHPQQPLPASRHSQETGQ